MFAALLVVDANPVTDVFPIVVTVADPGVEGFR